jgi:hypothetical protein
MNGESTCRGVAVSKVHRLSAVLRSHFASVYPFDIFSCKLLFAPAMASLMLGYWNAFVVLQVEE